MIDFAAARRVVQECLDEMYGDEPESPKVLPHGLDTGDAWAPVIDWDGVMGVYIYLVDKQTGELTPQSFAEFEDQSVTAVANLSGFHHLLASTRLKIANHPGHADQSSHGRKKKSAEPPAEERSGSGVDSLPRMGKMPTVRQAAAGANPNFGTTSNSGSPVYRDAGRAGKKWTPEMGPPPDGAFEQNCTNAVMAFEMRMRGYDVRAAPLDVLDKYGYAAGRTFAEAEQQLASNWRMPDGSAHDRNFGSQKWRSFKEVDTEIESWPEGGRGYVTTGRHVFNVTKTRGKAQYVEAQFDASPTRIVTAQYRKKYKATGWSSGGLEEAKLIRLDDLVPADGIMESVVAA